MKMSKPIGEILESKSEPAPKADVKPDPVDKPKPEAAEPAKARESTTVKTEPEPKEPKPKAEAPKAEEPEGGDRKWSYAAYADEKTKRQNLEREFGQFKARYSAQEAELAKLRQQNTPQPDIYSDPEGWGKARLDPVESQIKAQSFQMSEGLARLKFGDALFDEAAVAAERIEGEDPEEFQTLRHRLNNSKDPGAVLVTWYKNRKTLTETSDPEYLDKQIEKILSDPEKRSKYAPKFGIDPANPEVEKPASPTKEQLPSNLAGARSVGARNPAWQGTRPLGEIIQGGNKYAKAR